MWPALDLDEAARIALDELESMTLWFRYAELVKAKARVMSLALEV